MTPRTAMMFDDEADEREARHVLDAERIGGSFYTEHVKRNAPALARALLRTIQSTRAARTLVGAICDAYGDSAMPPEILPRRIAAAMALIDSLRERAEKAEATLATMGGET